jgi:hypothetical protein
VIILLTGLHIPWWASFSFFALWLFSFILDAKITTSCKNFMMYETNFLFRFFVGKYGTKSAVALQVLTEAGLIILVGYSFDLQLELKTMSVILLIFGLAHITAWYSNRNFLGRAAGAGNILHDKSRSKKVQ